MSPGDLNNACEEPRLPWGHLQMTFSRPSSNLNYHINSKLSPDRPQQLTCRAKASPVSLMYGHFKTILLQKLSYQLKALSPGRMT